METTTWLTIALATALNTTTAAHSDNPALYKYLENTSENVVLNVPFVHQKDDLPEEKKSEIQASACGPAALTMVLKYNKVKTSLIEVIDKLPSSVYIRGQMFYKLYDGPKYFGYMSESFKNSPEAIYTKLKEGYPIVLNVQNYNGITGHAVVVIGIKGYDGRTAKELLVHDPWTDAYKSYEYINNGMLKQPEGFDLPIGTLDPFIIKPGTLATKLQLAADGRQY